LLAQVKIEAAFHQQKYFTCVQRETVADIKIIQIGNALPGKNVDHRCYEE
jgi:hypothetical protein